MEVQNFRKPFIHLFSCSTGYHFRFMKAKKSQLLEKTERVKQQFLI